MAVMNATKTVVGVFDSMQQAEDVVRQLERDGFSRDDVSIVGHKDTSGRDTGADMATGSVTGASGTGSSVVADAGIGAALGGVGGLLLSFAALAIPGVGPVLAFGPLVAALGGAGIGAVAGGLIGALTEAGVPEEEAHYYAEGVRRGHVLVTVRTTEERAERAREVLDSSGAVDVEGRASEWRERGWTGHDPGAEPLSADELRRERDYYQSFERQGDEWGEIERGALTTGLPGTEWPHSTAHDTGKSLASAEAQNAASDAARTTRPADREFSDSARETTSAQEQPLPIDRRSLPDYSRSPHNAPSNFGDAVENNVRRPDPAVVKAERGFEDAKDSAVRSARRMASRIYDADKR
jgi:heat induced stress protein YflT